MWICGTLFVVALEDCLKIASISDNSLKLQLQLAGIVSDYSEKGTLRSDWSK